MKLIYNKEFFFFFFCIEFGLVDFWELQKEDMAKDSYEDAIAGLSKLLRYF